MDHADAVDATRALVAAADEAALRAWWVDSLTSRDLDVRGLWPAWTTLRHLPAHDFTPSREFNAASCEVCGLSREPDGAAPDGLEAAATLVAPEHPVDTAPLHALLAAVVALGPQAQLTELARCGTGVFRSTKWERVAVLEQLARVGVLRTDRPLPSDAWVTWDEENASQPAHWYKREWRYPARWWTGEHGVDLGRARALFGSLDDGGGGEQGRALAGPARS